jgi:hypothetical protein
LRLLPLPARQHHPPSVGPTESVQFCTDAAAATSVTSLIGARGNGELPMNDAQRYRMNAADCLSAAERCGPAYRDLTLAIASSWLSLARHQEAMDGLLTIWSRAQSAAPIRPAAVLTLRGTPGQMGNWLKGGPKDRELFMSSETYNGARTADRYRQIAAEYGDLSRDSGDPFLRPYYLRIAEGYTARADGELQAWQRQRITALACRADTRSPQPQPNAA